MGARGEGKKEYDVITTKTPAGTTELIKRYCLKSEETVSSHVAKLIEKDIQAKCDGRAGNLESLLSEVEAAGNAALSAMREIRKYASAFE